MKRKLSLLAFSLAASLSLHAASHGRTLGDTLILNLGAGIFPPPGGWNGGGPHHAPMYSVLPVCIIDGNTLLFIGTGNASLSYNILDEEDETCDSGSFTVAKGQEVSVSLATLPSGTYRLILALAGREYEGEFEKTDF